MFIDGFKCNLTKLKIAIVFLIGVLLMSLAPTVNAASQQYKLQEMVILSRHNIRSPLSGNGSALAEITPNKWFAWTSGPSELSLRGGELETLMGQYFRQWLVKEGLMSENYIPAEGEFRFYANSMQRTIATAQYFSSGMLPVANVRIEHKFAPSKMDPVFNPQLTFVSDAFRAEALKQIGQMGGTRGLQGINNGLQKEYALLEKVLNMKKSDYAKKNGVDKFQMNDLEIILEVNKEPAMRGSLKLANQASDAFILQYYEESDPVKAAFGNKLSKSQWEQIARVKDVYGDVLFTAPIVAVNVAHPLLQVMSDELALPDRKFTFLCGHDSNIASVLAALEVEDYSLPNTIEKKTPIGSKLVIQKFIGKDGVQYADLSLVYQTTDQLRNRTMLTLNTPPMIFPLKLKGLTANADGMYLLSDLQKRFNKAISAYDALPEDRVSQAA